jgi:hypothetical protein
MSTRACANKRSYKDDSSSEEMEVQVEVDDDSWVVEWRAKLGEVGGDDDDEDNEGEDDETGECKIFILYI